MNKVFSSIKKINWKRVGIGILIIYIIAWSYVFLALKYAEHMQDNFYTAISQCSKYDDSQKCVDALKKYQSNLYWLFKPVIGR